MNPAYLSALSALAGSAIGALATFATTWLTQHHQEQSARWAQESAKREQLYGDFVDLASQLFADALGHSFDEPKKVVPLYAMIGRLRLFASKEAVRSAESVMALIIDTYYAPNRDFKSREAIQGEELNPLREFTEICRGDLNR